MSLPSLYTVGSTELSWAFHKSKERKSTWGEICTSELFELNHGRTSSTVLFVCVLAYTEYHHWYFFRLTFNKYATLFAADSTSAYHEIRHFSHSYCTLSDIISLSPLCRDFLFREIKKTHYIQSYCTAAAQTWQLFHFLLSFHSLIVFYSVLCPVTQKCNLAATLPQSLFFPLPPELAFPIAQHLYTHYRTTRISRANAQGGLITSSLSRSAPQKVHEPGRMKA